MSAFLTLIQSILGRQKEVFYLVLQDLDYKSHKKDDAPDPLLKPLMQRPKILAINGKDFL